MNQGYLAANEARIRKMIQTIMNILNDNLKPI